MLGETLDGKYHIARELGRGGMGAVYEAIHLGTRRRVAVKVILNAGAANREMLERFQREAKAAGAIDTQHIVEVLDTGVDVARGFPYMVMEYLHGEDLQQIVRRFGPLPPELALRIAAQACIGLKKAHEAGVVHRDIKPANVYLGRRDEGEILVKVLDFGIAKIIPDITGAQQDHGLTRTGSMLGSPLYMSPEQARGAKTADHRADIWSFGALIYETLCGHSPFYRVETLGELIYTIISQPPPPLQGEAPWVAPEIAAIVHRALMADPNARFQTMGAMLEALRALLPHGHALHDSMIAPLPEAYRGYVAPRFETTGDAAISGASSAPRGPIHSSSSGGSGASAVPSHTPGVSGAGLSRSQPQPPRRPLARSIAAGSAVLVVVAGGAAWTALRPGADRGAALPTPDPSTLPVAPVAPSAPVEAAPRADRLAVVPPDAAVQVDGREATVREGWVEIAGALGSAHHVKVQSGARVTEVDVFLTEAGVRPARVELDPAAPPPSSLRPQPSVSRPQPSTLRPQPSVAPVQPSVSRPQPSSRPPAGPSIDREFN